MKILCDRNQIHEAFSLAAGIVPQKTPKPILQNVLLDAEGDSLTVFATDYEIWVSIEVDSVKITEPGQTLLPARQTSALLRELSDPTLTLESREFRCTLESGGGSFVLVGDDPEQFPGETRIGDGKTLTMPAGVLMGMIRKTIFAAAKEESRYMINGVLFDCRDDCLRLVATDGRRLALNYYNLDGNLDGNLGGNLEGNLDGDLNGGGRESGDDEAAGIRCVVPIRALQMLTRAIAEDSPEKIQITFTENQVGFRFGKTSLISQLLESNFPDFDVVIPKAADTSCELDRQTLEHNVRKVAILSSGDLRVIKMNFSSHSLELSAESSDVGRADQVMDVDVKGAGGVLSFNPDFLLEALKVTDLDVVRLDMSDDSTPAKMSLGESFTYILMPISGS